jgi:DNA-binding Xre family transcriptional regulator
VPWSETDFRARCRQRAAELGKSHRKLMAEHGIGHDTLDKTPSAGRRIDTLEKIGIALDWSLAEVLGFDVPGKISLHL